ncbi:MAG: 3-oxoacyl-[acyl-carrier-protein] reductase [Eubacteriales bacterium]
MAENAVTPAAIITGASRGIGAAIAETFAEKGYNLVLVYRSGKEEAEAVKARCEEIQSGIRVIIAGADVSMEADCQHIFDVAKEAFGRVDVLVNNAGQTKDGLTMRMSLDQFTSVIDINLTSAFMLSKLCLPLMSRQRKGRIINMSSIAGVYGNAGQANYSASKAGMIGLTKSLAREMGSRNITVNAVAPGFIETDMTASLSEDLKKAAAARIPLGRLGQAKEVASVVAFLASDDASYITGQVVEVSGGLVL